ncbi:hypothetical protein As57867_004271, partial [Aphanomyces stellatus]
GYIILHRVDHTYLLTVLRHYGFPQVFVDIVRVLYSDRRSKILVNGDPLSPLLFVIALEPLCQILRQNPDYGIKTGDTVHTGSYFADDSQLCAANEECLHRQLALVQSFCDKSGFRLNVDKTQILTFAPLSPASASMAVTSEAPTKSLGILVAPNLSSRARFNYVFERFVSRLSLWLYKARTYAGKVAILHSICLPVLWYQLSFVSADKNLAKLIDRVMLQFMHGEEINPTSTTTGLRFKRSSSHEAAIQVQDGCVDIPRVRSVGQSVPPLGISTRRSLCQWQLDIHAPIDAEPQRHAHVECHAVKLV